MPDMNTQQIEHTWAVIRNYNTLGYVKHQSEWTAEKIAKSNFGNDVRIERIYLVGVVPEGSVVHYSHT